MGVYMDFDYLEGLRQHNASLRLLRSPNMPLIIAFLHHTFPEPSVPALPENEIASQLSDFLFRVRERLGDERFPGSAQWYLDNWSSGADGFLHKFYPRDSDEPSYEPTPAVERAISWLRTLRERSFVGTESRLLSIYQLLKEVQQMATRDPQERIDALEKRRREIDQEIARIKAEGLAPVSATQVRERFHLIEDTARSLLSDFRQIESNFRQLDKHTRTRIATSDQPKGLLLAEIFTDHDVIWDTDEGQSFRAFWEFMLSLPRKTELETLIRQILAMEEVRSEGEGSTLAGFSYALLEAGNRVYRTVQKLVEQLRGYLNEQTHLENRRIMEVIREIEKSLVDVRSSPPTGDFAAVADVKTAINLPMLRGLYARIKPVAMDDAVVQTGEHTEAPDEAVLAEYVDEERLRDRIHEALSSRSQVSLPQILEQFPLEKGLAEILTYFKLASDDSRALIDEVAQDTFDYPTIEGTIRRVECPRLIFVR